MESEELQAVHISKKLVDILMARHDLPSEMKA